MAIASVLSTTLCGIRISNPYSQKGSLILASASLDVPGEAPALVLLLQSPVHIGGDGYSKLLVGNVTGKGKGSKMQIGVSNPSPLPGGLGGSLKIQASRCGDNQRNLCY